MKAPKYKVRVIEIEKLIHYHIVNIETNITHSSRKSLQAALESMRDLNRMVR